MVFRVWPFLLIGAFILIERSWTATLSPSTSLSQTRIADGGIVGNLYLPETGGRYPAVIVIGGSEGGVEWSAPLGAPLALRGFAALALAYFGTDPLPQRLQEIPLEYFKLAIDRLRAHPSVDPARIGLIGFSKGAEAALLIAVAYPDVRVVVASAPTHVAWQGVTGDPTTVGRVVEPDVRVPRTIPVTLNRRSGDGEQEITRVGG